MVGNLDKTITNDDYGLNACLCDFAEILPLISYLTTWSHFVSGNLMGTYTATNYSQKEVGVMQ